MVSGQLSYEEIAASLAAIVQPKSVFEIRLLASRRKRVDGGYFDSIEACATALSGLQEAYSGVYITPNPVNPELLSRAANRIKPWAEFTTDDASILRRVWLLIDIDPKRPSGISSTGLEHKRAIALAREISGMLDIEYGWCDPMIVSSGNGAHVMYPLNEPNDVATRDILHNFLKTLANRFNGKGCEVDLTSFNASRIWRLPGTIARKGDSTLERPHRKARILQEACPYSVVSVKQLQEFIDGNPLPLNGTRYRKQDKPPPPHEEQIYRHLNKAAMQRLDEWVITYFPGARTYKEGYRVSSEELGRDREEDISIQPFPIGILDFGEHDDVDELREGKRTPTSLLAEFHFDNDLKAAATALAGLLQVPLTEFDDLPETVPLKEGYDDIFGSGGFDYANIKSYTQLQNKEFKSLKWIIPNVLPVGCFILAARPKMRKTWLALQWCLAVATGGSFLEWRVNKGTALFLGLEDNERRIKSRIETLHTFDMDLPNLDSFHYFTEGTFPRGDDGVEILRKYLDENPDCTMIVIDTFAHFRKMSKERDVYLKDYIAVMPLTRLAAERQVCILVVHHEKKGLAGNDSGDFIEDVNGSSGITGGVDGIISIKGRRGVQEETESRKLLITGRDIPNDYELDISFDAERGGWLQAARQDVKTAIRQLFASHPFMMQNEIISFLPNMPPSRVRRALLEMKFAGELDQSRHGYTIRS